MSNSKISALTSATTPLAGTEVLPIVQSSTTKQVSIANVTAGRDVAGKSFAATSGMLSTNLGTGGMFVCGDGSPDVGYVAYNYSNVSGTEAVTFSNRASWRQGFLNGAPVEWNLDYRAANAATNAFTNYLKVSSAGDVTVKVGNLIQGTAAKGINFTANTPAAGMTSQLLNWYEEGTFSPTVIGTITAGTVTYNSRYGRYTRVGRLVTFEIYLYWVSGTGTGFLRFGGLPFTSASSNTYPSITIGSFYALTFNVGTYLSAAITGNGTTTIDLYNCPTGGVAVTPGSVTYNASGAIQLTGSYSI